MAPELPSRPPATTIGTAGWSIPRLAAHLCPGAGTHLERYSRCFGGAEINSSFYRSHSPATYARWARSTPDDFRFSLKLPKTLTHDQRLQAPDAGLEHFLAETAALGSKRAVILVQMPPSLAFEREVAYPFFDALRRRYEGLVVCEPRHASWFEDSAAELYSRFSVARVAADPPVVVGADRPGGAHCVSYFRLHGSPRRYWSRYEPDYLSRLAQTLAASLPQPAWCIFDNTASGAAFENAYELQRLLDF